MPEVIVVDDEQTSLHQLVRQKRHVKRFEM